MNTFSHDEKSDVLLRRVMRQRSRVDVMRRRSRGNVMCCRLSAATLKQQSCFWWAQVDSNHRPRAYQARALTN